MTPGQAWERSIRRLHSTRTRAAEGMVLIEGVRAVEEALDASVDVVYVAASPVLRQRPGGEALAFRLEAGGIDVEWVEDPVLARLADTETPQGVVLVAGEPRLDREAVTELLEGPRLLALDGVQDPGNVGTLVRAAVAFSLDGIVVLDGTADPWSPKSVRASAGYVFRLQVARLTWEEWWEARGRGGAPADLPILVAAADGEDVAGLGAPESWALVLGNEGRGVREEIASIADRRVAIPMRGPAESLNVGVAGAILLYALAGGARREPSRIGSVQPQGGEE